MLDRNTLIELAETLERDVSVYVYLDMEENIPVVDITIHDFEGFTDDWEEEYRELDNPAGVDALQELLEKHYVSKEDDLYTVYYMEGYKVIWGYTSFDI